MGVEFTQLNLTLNGHTDLSTLSVTTSNTCLAASTRVSNVMGVASPVAAVTTVACTAGVPIFLDICRSNAHMPFGLSVLNVDFTISSPHKMLGPAGADALWGRHVPLAAIPPVLAGDSMIEWVTMEELTFMVSPEHFEVGSQFVVQTTIWPRTLRYLPMLGMDHVRVHEHVLVRMIFDGILSIDDVQVPGLNPDVDRIGVIAFAVDGAHPHDIGQFMDSVDVAMHVGHHYAIPLHMFLRVCSSVRTSVASTTIAQGINRFVGGLSKVRSFFGRQNRQQYRSHLERLSWGVLNNYTSR